MRLSVLDEPARLALDDSIFEGNIRALHAIDAPFARELHQTAVEREWSPVVGLDGFATWRVAPDGDQPFWLGQTAVPSRRAQAIAAAARRDQSVALPQIGAGAEIGALMERIGPLASVFVFEPVLLNLAAVLRTLDLADAIASMRCILAPIGREEQFVDDLLRHHAGLLPPARVIPMPGSTSARMEFVHALCTQAAREVTTARDRRLKEIHGAGPPETAPNALAILSLRSDDRAHELARGLADGAACHGSEVRVCVADSPLRAHPLAHAEVLKGFAPRATICVDHAPSAVPIPIRGALCQWHLEPIDDRAGDLAADVIHLAATPTIEAELIAAGVSPGNRMPFYHAVEPQESEYADPVHTRKVVIVADLPDDRPEAYGIAQPTHKILWEALRRVIAKQWTTPEIAQPGAILKRAEKQSRVAFGEPTLRARLLRIVARGLIPAVVLERIVAELGHAGYECGAVGAGWRRLNGVRVEPLAESVRALTEAQWETRPAAALFPYGSDPLSRDLLAVADRLWPIIIQTPDANRVREALGGVLEPDRHYDAFSNPRELSACVSTAIANPSAGSSRAERCREHLRARHSYAVRVGQLLDWLCTRTGEER